MPDGDLWPTPDLPVPMRRKHCFSLHFERGNPGNASSGRDPYHPGVIPLTETCPDGCQTAKVVDRFTAKICRNFYPEA
jgi:hypothetical protein